MRPLDENIIILSDIHSGLHQSSPLWHTITINFGKWLDEVCRKRNIKTIIIAGDVNNNRNEITVTTLNCLVEFFKILQNYNIIITVGNHDCLLNQRSDIHSLRILDEWPNITIIDKLTIITATSEQKVIALCPWGTIPSQIPQCDICIGHFAINTFSMGSKRICDDGISAKDLLEKSKLVISGHFHGMEERKYAIGTILYVGSPYEQNWGEMNCRKGVFELNIPSGKYEFIENTISPKHKKIRLTELLASGITPTIRQEFNGNIVNFTIDYTVDATTYSNIVSKLSLLKPLDLKTEYAINTEIYNDNIENDYKGINIQEDVIEYIKTLEHVENKDTLINYLKDVYQKAELLMKV